MANFGSKSETFAYLVGKAIAEIEAKIAKADIHTTLIANGVITVK